MKQFFSALGIIQSASRNIFVNLSPSQLVQHSVEKKVGELTNSGALLIKTGKHTGRAAQDKYVVKTLSTENTVWWNKNIREMGPQTFNLIENEVISYLNDNHDLYLSDRSVGADPKYNIGVRVLSTSPAHCLFTEYLFREKCHEFGDQDFTILHAPYLQINAEKFGTRSETVIVTDFDQRKILIVGSAYAGEIKKSMFSVMNYLLPFKNVLPMHTGANVSDSGVVSLFFGLSGTGKTTLSTDIGHKLIGDDEHGLSDNGVFNFEGGCYAKTYQLSKDNEPEIYAAINRPWALLENVMLDPNSKAPQFDDKSLTENGRGSYPLNFISERVESALAKKPDHLFFLSADAFGILPAVAKLTNNQAMYYFLSGYTAKLAGTEIGVVQPEAAFSACFGAPFMVQKPMVYASLLGNYLKNNPQTSVWLINTGWVGGGHGVGKRFPLKVTREIIRAIQKGQLEAANYHLENFFGFNIPESVPGVESVLLNPREAWADKDLYDATASKLSQMFRKNTENFPALDENVLCAGPCTLN